MNGLTEHELKTRKAIRELINGGEYSKAEQLCRKFLKHSQRGKRRLALMQTVRLFVPLMNGELHGGKQQ
jgi:hypothetical protein